MQEELDEVKDAIAQGSQPHLEEELGDLLLAIVKLCHWKDVQAEEIMHAAVKKYDRRYRAMEQELKQQGLSPAEASIEQKMRAWKIAKEKCR